VRLVAWSLAVLLGACGLPPARAAETSPITERLLDHRGQIVVVNFWAAWCGPCKNELPLLAALDREYEGRGVQFIGASTDAADEREEAMALLAQSGVGYPILFGLSDVDVREIGLGSLLPATAVFDRDGTRAFRLVGEVTKKRLVQRLEWLLGNRAARPPRELLLPPGIDAAEYAR
jgi:thiol-disulfide isomerase/thioredoxin